MIYLGLRLRHCFQPIFNFPSRLDWNVHLLYTFCIGAITVANTKKCAVGITSTISQYPLLLYKMHCMPHGDFHVIKIGGIACFSQSVWSWPIGGAGGTPAPRLSGGLVLTPYMKLTYWLTQYSISGAFPQYSISGAFPAHPPNSYTRK